MMRFVFLSIVCGAALGVATADGGSKPVAVESVRQETKPRHVPAGLKDRDFTIDTIVKSKLADKITLDLRGSFESGRSPVLVSDKMIPAGMATLTHLANQRLTEQAAQPTRRKQR